jgi:hypothetical protein
MELLLPKWMEQQMMYQPINTKRKFTNFSFLIYLLFFFFFLVIFRNGFPTILYAPAGDKQNPQTYSGERKIKDFVDYLKKNSKKMTKKEKEL